MTADVWARDLITVVPSGPHQEGCWEVRCLGRFVSVYIGRAHAENRALRERENLHHVLSHILAREQAPRMRGRDMTPERLAELRDLRRPGRNTSLLIGEQDELLDYIDLLHSLLLHDSEAYNQGFRDGQAAVAEKSTGQSARGEP